MSSVATSRRGFAYLGWFGALLTVGGQAALRADSDSIPATLVFLVGSGMLAMALHQRDAGLTDPFEQPSSKPARHPNLALLYLSGGAIALAYGSYLLCTRWQLSFYPGWALLIAGTAAASLGLWLRDPSDATGRRWRPLDFGLLLLILIAGTWLRAHRLSDFPDGFTTHAIEEQQTGLGGYRVIHQGIRPWEFALDYQMTALALWFDSLPNFTTIRVPYVIVSALTIVPVHLLLRQLFTTRAAFAGTFLYAMLSWNLLYARCAHPIFPTNILVISILALLLHFGRTRRLAGLPWVGLLSGYTLYSYAGFRGTPLFVLLFLAGILARAVWRAGWSAKDFKQLARPLAALGVFLAVMTATAAPLAVQLRRTPGNYYLEAADRAFANKEYYTTDYAAFVAQRIERLREVGRIFMHFGDGSPTFNFPGEPMLDPITACLATVGLLLMLLRPMRGYNVFLLVMAGVLLMVGTVFVQNLDVRRLQGITIFVVIAAAIAIEQIWAATDSAKPTLRRLALVAGIIAALGVSGFSYNLYFVRMANDAAIRRSFKDYYTTLIRFGQEQGNGRKILLSSIMHRFFDSDYHYRYNYSWLIDRSLSGDNLGDIDSLFAARGSYDDRVATTVVIQRPFEIEAVAALLAQAYPAIRCREFIESDNPWVGLIACDLPDLVEPKPVTMRLEAKYWQSAEPKGPPKLTRSEPFIGYAVTPAICYAPAPGQLCHAEWRGEFEVGSDTDHQLKVELVGRTVNVVRLDGVNIDRFPYPLTPGKHVLEISAQLPRDWETGVRVSWIRNGKEEVLPFWLPSQS